MYLSLVYLIVLITSAFKNISCACTTTFLTKCDTFRDLNKNGLNVTGSEKFVELQIGDESSRKEKESVNLHGFNFHAFNGLRSMKIINRINNLENNVLTDSNGCHYNLKLDYLTLYGNVLATIKQNSIPTIKLKVLDMKNNQIEKLERLSLRWNEVEVLDLSDNRIEEIEHGTLPQSNVTKSIILSNNKIFFIGAENFGPSLEVLDLSRNKLRGLEDKILQNLMELRVLILKHNKLISVPKVESLTNLRVLDFSHAELQQVLAEDNLDKLMNLEILDLSFNNLVAVHFWWNLLKPEKKLTISLEFNLLIDVSLKDRVIPENNGTRVLFYGNPWQCENWSKNEVAFKDFLDQCDSERFRDGRTPFCVHFDSYDHTYGFSDITSRFRNTGNYRSCNLEPEKAKIIYETTQVCPLTRVF